jgi:hypothetical protein
MPRKQKEYKYHYTYRITNIVEKKYYYGVHSCDCLPKEDIGVKYFSSTKPEFVKDQKQNHQNYKYKVIKIFKTRKEAVEHEIFLHNKFEVGKNPKFYNGAKQTSTGFDRTGTKASEKTIALQKEIQNKPEYKNKIKSKLYDRLNNEEWYSTKFMAGVDKLKELKNSKEWKETVGVIASQKMVETKRKNNTMPTLEKNPKAKIIHIYDNNSKLKFICHGNFKNICIDNNLPFKQLKWSYQNNGSKIYNKNKNIHSRRNDWEFFYNWYALVQ